MIFEFEKYQGTGNDFVMIDNRNNSFDVNQLPVAHICDRRFGIGSDGLIVIEEHPTLDFNMIYFNADGTQSFCGNGSRCAVVFAKSLGIIGSQTNFLSTDGEHYAEISPDNEVRLKMHDVLETETRGQDYVINTGSPHYIIQRSRLDDLDIVPEARSIRNNAEFKEHGINVNFIRLEGDQIEIRTYERGVENETLSCGTGVTAAALAMHLNRKGIEGTHTSNIKTEGGSLSVQFTYRNGAFSDIFLIGPGKKSFEGRFSYQ